MRRLVALLLNLGATKRSWVPWSPFPAPYIAMTLARLQPPQTARGSGVPWGTGACRNTYQAGVRISLRPDGLRREQVQRQWREEDKEEEHQEDKEEEPAAHKLLVSVQNVASRSTSVFIRFHKLPMLTHADVCGHMLTYADVCRSSSAFTSSRCSRTHTLRVWCP